MAEVNKKEITVDDSFEQVLELDKSGALLSFRTKPGMFLELTEAQAKQLGSRTRQAYFISREAWTERLAEADAVMVNGSVDAKAAKPFIAAGTDADGGQLFKLNDQVGSASRRLQMGEVMEGYDPTDFYYERAEDVEEAIASGAEVATTGIRSAANPSGVGIHRITRKGHDELILMHRKDREKLRAADLRRTKQSLQGANEKGNEDRERSILKYQRDRGANVSVAAVREEDWTPVGKE